MWRDKDEEMLQILEYYFGEIFNSSNPSALDMEAATNCIRRSVLVEDHLMIEAPFIEDEVVQTLKEMGSTKAPGLDGSMRFSFRRIGI